jgi:hypothetical protein
MNLFDYGVCEICDKLYHKIKTPKSLAVISEKLCAECAKKYLERLKRIGQKK